MSRMRARFSSDHGGVSRVLFTSTFAAQAGVIAIAPVLTAVASDLDVSTAAAAQVRTLSGLAAGITALSLARFGRRFALRSLLFAGTGALAAGSVGSAAAPSFAVLLAAQGAVGVGVALLITAATAAAAEWVAPG